MVVTTRSATQLRSRHFAQAGRKKNNVKLRRSKLHKKIAMAVIPRSRADYMNRLLNLNEQQTRLMVHMTRAQLNNLCMLLESHAGLKSSNSIDLSEKVYMFLAIVAHGASHSILQFAFLRSGSTVIKSFNEVLDAVVSMRDVLLARPVPVPRGCRDDPWCHFEGCVGVVDGMRLGPVDYLLAACGKDLRFTYVNTNLDGSRCPMRVLKEALEADESIVPEPGTYYLASCQFANIPGFLAPYRVVNCRHAPDEPGYMGAKEYFNDRHNHAATTSRRAFGILKKRFAILRTGGLAWYRRDRQLKIIVACCLLHNLIHATDPIDEWGVAELDDEYPDDEAEVEIPHYEEPNEHGFPGTLGWKRFRESITECMYRRWLRMMDLPLEFDM